MPDVPKPYPCDICRRKFARTEHLERHYRTHTKEKPYACQYCSHKFSRTDLHRRHIELYHSSGGLDVEDGAGDADSQEQIRKRLRTRNACDTCNSRKLKCEESRPCRRCQEKGLDCVVSANRSSTRNGEKEHSPSASNRASGANRYGRGNISDAQLHSGSGNGLPFDASEVQNPGLDWNADLDMSQTLASNSIYGHQMHPIGVIPTQSTSTHAFASMPPQAGTALPEGSEAELNSTPGTGMGDGSWTTEPLFSDTQGLDNFYQNMETMCNSVPVGDIFDFSTSDGFPIDWNDFNQMAYGDVALQDIFDGHASAFNITPPWMPNSETPWPVQPPPKPPNLPKADAFVRFEKLSDVNMSRPASPRAIQARHHWFSAIRNDDVSISIMKDRELIDEFIWLFRDNVAGWFSVFRNQEVKITSTTRKEWYLLMAAVGGLFCPTNGAIRVAKWFYHSGRQLLLSYVCSRASQKFSASEGISILETFILLQLFGYLCGDKRIYELIEIVHLQMIQVARDLNIYGSNSSVDERKRQEIREALLVLDCYRVVLLQRPPGSGLRELLPVNKVAEAGNVDRFPWLLADLMKRENQLEDSLYDASESLQILCSLGLFTWNLVPSSSGPHVKSQSLWSSPFLETALDQWRRSSLAAPDIGTMVLFHTIHLNTFVCLPDVQSFAVRWLASHKESGGTTDAAATEQRLRNESRREFDLIALGAQFKTNQHRLKAVWHARQILGLLQVTPEKSSQAAPNNSLGGMLGERTNQRSLGMPPRNLPPRGHPPHLAHCICFATLSLWCEALLSNNMDERLPRKWLSIGAQILEDQGIEGGHILQQFKSIILDLAK